MLNIMKYFPLRNPVKGLYKYIKLQFEIMNMKVDTIDMQLDTIIERLDEKKINSINNDITTLLQKVNEIEFILDPHSKEKEILKDQKEKWKNLQDKNILFPLNISLQPYNYSIGIQKDGQIMLYNHPKSYTQEEYIHFIKRINDKRLEEGKKKLPLLNEILGGESDV